MSNDAPTPQHIGGLRRIALHGYAALPRRVRVNLVRRLTPNFTIGALCVLEHNGALLMLRQHHRHGWTLPGGLMDRGESPAQAVTREVGEELGLRIEVAQPLTFVVDALEHRVDIIFHVPCDDAFAVTPYGEAVEAQWLHPTAVGAVDRSTRQALAAFTAAISGPRPTQGRLVP